LGACDGVGRGGHRSDRLGWSCEASPGDGGPLTEDSLPLAELPQKAGDGDFLRSVAEAVPQIPMEADLEGLIGAGRYERSAERMNGRRYHDACLC
jgi:hypothetical protein